MSNELDKIASNIHDRAITVGEHVAAIGAELVFAHSLLGDRFGGWLKFEFGALVIEYRRLRNAADIGRVFIIGGNLPTEDAPHVVYGLADPRNAEWFYFGKTAKFRKRMAQHCQLFSKGRLTIRKAEIFAAGLPIIAASLMRGRDDAEAGTGEQVFIDAFPECLNHQRAKYLPRERRYG